MNPSDIKKSASLIYQLEAVILAGIKSSETDYARMSCLWDVGLPQDDVDRLFKQMNDACRLLVKQTTDAFALDILAKLVQIGNPLDEFEVVKLTEAVRMKEQSSAIAKASRRNDKSDADEMTVN